MFRVLLVALLCLGCSERVWAPISAPVEITTTTLPSGTVGVPYSFTLEATGGDGTYTWALSGGPTLPDGLTLNPITGEISGTPTPPTPAQNHAIFKTISLIALNVG